MSESTEGTTLANASADQLRRFEAWLAAGEPVPSPKAPLSAEEHQYFPLPFPVSQAAEGVELAVPDQAVVELNAWTNDALPPRDRHRVARDIAEPIVAAELRRLAQVHGYVDCDGLQVGVIDCDALNRRADELDRRA